MVGIETFFEEMCGVRTGYEWEGDGGSVSLCWREEAHNQ